MLDSLLTEEAREIRALVRKFAEERIKPLRRILDEEGRFPREILEEMGALDLFRVFIPEAYGGFGFSALNFYVVMEELARVEPGISLTYQVTAAGALPLVLGGDEALKARFLPQVAEGALAALCITEPGAGSDVASIRTRAVRDGDRYVLTGEKNFVTNATQAAFYTVLAVTDPEKGHRGISAFVVEADRSGLSFGPPYEKMGMRSSIQCDLKLEEVEIPVSNRIGAEGEGFRLAMRTLDHTRPGIAAQAIGIAQGAMEEAITYAKERQAFGVPLIEHQAIQFMLADMAIQIHAARSFLYALARYIDQGGKDFTLQASMVKTFASDMAVRVTRDAVQVFGGYGYSREYPVEKFMRDAKATQIYEGTNEIQRWIIGRKIGEWVRGEV